MNPFTAAHIAAEAKLRAHVVSVVTAIWHALKGHDQADVPTFLDHVVPTVTAAQRQSALLTDAYLARMMDRAPLGLDTNNLVGAAVRNGATPDEVYKRPFVTLWAALGNGKSFEDASNAALARAKSTAAMDVQLSMRAAADAVDKADPHMFGFKRVADATACEFCRAVDGAYVKRADAMPLHNNCGCGLAPLTEPHKGAVFLPDGTRIREHRYGPLISTPLPKEVAVHEHGELGPLLTAPGDHFTTEAEAEFLALH